MCRYTVEPNNQVLLTLQQQLRNLNVGDQAGPIVGRGSGPRLFCGHVPPEATEELVKAHFSQWGTVTDVYFPKNKHTFRRRPFCFVTFATLDAAQSALAESPMNICGIPIKQLTMVEDRMDYYKNRNLAAQNALVQALQTLALVNNNAAGGAPPPAGAGPSSAGSGSPPLGGAQPALDINNLAALLALEGSGAGVRAAPPPHQAYPAPQAPAYGQQANRYSAGPTPFPGMLNPADLAAATSALRMSAGPAYAGYAPGPAGAPGYAPPASLALDVAALQLPGDTLGWAASMPSTDGSYSLPGGSAVASSSVGSPMSGSPPLSGARGMGLPPMAGLRSAEQQAIEAASWGLTGGAFTAGP
eukprot:scaffold2.g7211.t1